MCNNMCVWIEWLGEVVVLMPIGIKIYDYDGVV